MVNNLLFFEQSRYLFPKMAMSIDSGEKMRGVCSVFVHEKYEI